MINELLSRWPVIRQIKNGSNGTGPEVVLPTLVPSTVGTMASDYFTFDTDLPNLIVLASARAIPIARRPYVPSRWSGYENRTEQPHNKCPDGYLAFYNPNHPDGERSEKSLTGGALDHLA
jgi:hypothetical protein